MQPTQRYQVLIIDTNGPRYRDVLKHTLNARIRDLNLDPDGDLEILEAEQSKDLDERAPKAGVFFAGGTILATHESAIQRLQELAAVIIPVVPSLDRFADLVPESLRSINGIALNPTDPEFHEIAGYVLEALYLVRNRRRLFLSYRRSESRNAAVQLYEEFDQRAYDVFIDTHAVPKGDIFQDVLWHRMSDSDVVVFLHTTGALSSRWVAEEVANANKMGITLLEVIWPDVKRDERSFEGLYLFQPYYLKDLDFTSFDPTATGGSNIQPATVSQIAVQLERLRARALAAREARLVKTLCDAATLAGLVTTVQHTRCVDVQTKRGGERVRVFLGLGVPDAVSYQDSHRAFDPDPPAQTRLLYDPEWIMPTWRRHLDWLDQYLPTKRVLLPEMNQWLNTL